jgi:hypothetical protein
MKKILEIIIPLMLIISVASCGPSEVIVSERPVEPVYERPVAPGPDYVWVDGEWYSSGGRYAYRNGYWVKPHHSQTWQRGEWQQKGNGWYWHKGHWHS